MLAPHSAFRHGHSIYAVCLFALFLGGTSAAAQFDCEKTSREELRSRISSESQDETEEDGDLGLPIFLTSMIHLEGGSRDAEGLRFFLETVDYLKDAMDLAEKYCAIQTIESERPFAVASTWWKPDFFPDVLFRGHGVGTHCDVGFSDSTSSYGEFVLALQANKKLMDDLVGEENNTGCSGAGSEFDWVNALSSAGFTYVDGVVGMHYLALPVSNRPNGYTDSAIRSGGLYHNQAPVDLLDRTYLRTLKNTFDLEHDDDGVLVLSSGSLGKLQGISEGAYLSEAYYETNLELSLDTSDVDALVDLIQQIDEDRDRSRVSKITLMSHAVDWDRDDDHNRPVMKYFLQRMKILADRGTIEWAAEKEVVDIYLDLMEEEATSSE